MSDIQPKIFYEAHVAVYNDKTQKWEEATTDMGFKTAKFIAEEANLELFKAAKPGDVIEFTENGIYKKSAEGWVNALSTKEQKDTFPSVKKVIQSVSKRIATQPKQKMEMETEQAVESLASKQKGTKFVIELRAVGGIPPDSKDWAAKIKEQHPVLSEELSRHLTQFESLINQYDAIVETKGEILEPETLQLSKDILRQKAVIEHLVESAKTADYAEQIIPALPKRELQVLGKGQAKVVYLDPTQPEYAFLVPVSSLFDSVINLKEAEIREEVQTAKKIKDNLQKSKLHQLFAEKRIQNPWNSVNALFSKFGTLEGILAAIEEKNAANFAQETQLSSEDTSIIIDLKDEMNEIQKSGQNLAIDLEEVPDSEKIEGRYTVRMGRASIDTPDLEKAIQKPDLDFAASIQFTSGFFQGMEDLHESGHVHGDLKPENVLVFDSPRGKTVKLGDFGKTKPIKEDEELLHTGNARFGAVEMKLSKKGEVYSSALIAIRILEENLLKDAPNQMLLSPSEVDPSIQPRSNRRGVEKFVVMNKDLTQSETTTLRNKAKVYSGRLTRLISSPGTPIKAQNEMHRYIDQLTNSIKGKESADPAKMDNLNALLKDMTRSDPKARPTMQEANKRFKAIGLP